MFAPMRPTTAVTEASAPGTSGISTLSRVRQPRSRERAHDHRGQQPSVDVPTAQDETDAPPAEAVRVLEHRGERGGARALGDHPRHLEVRADGCLERRLAHRDDVVDELANDRERELARFADGDAVGNGVAGLERLAAERRHHRRALRGLDADDLDLPPEAARRDRDARHQTAATDGDHDHLDLGVVVEQLERERALARDHGRVVVRRHIGEVLGAGNLVRVATGFA